MGFAVASLVVLGSGCRTTAEQTSAASDAAAPALAASVQVAAEKRAACEGLRKHIAGQPALPGAPGMEAQRTFLLGRAKGSPVVFLQRPARDLSDAQPYARALVERMDDPRQALPTLQTLHSWLPHQLPLVRAAIMPEGYFFSESPDAAEWMEIIFKLEHLFKEKELWLLRGSEIRKLRRDELVYRFAEGPDEGREAALLMFDRVSPDRSKLEPALHVDLVPAVAEYGFDRVEVERLTAEGINVRLRYGAKDVWTTAVLKITGARARVECELVDDGVSERVFAFRKEARQRERAVARLREAVALQVDENLPFDEPREEVGQQDGSLRPAWAWAYNHGGTYYKFNEVSYSVFDSKDRPRPPQVCIDFVLDSYERASGTWFEPRKEERGRVVGGIDFERYSMPNRRGVESVVNFFREHPELFQVWDLPQTERVPYRDRQTFLGYLASHADDFRPADVVVIHGPKGAENHYHSFFVYQSDPVSGMPMLLAGNAGKPRVRPWSAVMASAPMRSIKHRLRPELSWLAKGLGVSEEESRSQAR
jgi:hypothetical protein